MLKIAKWKRMASYESCAKKKNQRHTNFSKRLEKICYKTVCAYIYMQLNEIFNPVGSEAGLRQTETNAGR